MQEDKLLLDTQRIPTANASSTFGTAIGNASNGLPKVMACDLADCSSAGPHTHTVQTPSATSAATSALSPGALMPSSLDIKTLLLRIRVCAAVCALCASVRDCI